MQGLNAVGFTLYLNLWGTTAKLLEGRELSGSVHECQRRFFAVLKQLAQENQGCQVAHLGDLAFVTSESALELGQFAASTICRMLTADECFRFWPVRGAIAHGCMNFETSFQHERFYSMAFTGAPAVKAALLEKSAQKGIRLFAESDLFMTPQARHRETRGSPHAELNWLTLAPKDDEQRILAFEKQLQDEANRLIEIGSNYSQQMGASVFDLFRWATNFVASPL